MIELRKTPGFLRWLDGLRNLVARGRIQTRLRLLEEGHAGDHKYVGEGVFELRIHCGPGYRVYRVHRGSAVIVVLAGGDKGSQDKDIRRALETAGRL